MKQLLTVLVLAMVFFHSCAEVSYEEIEVVSPQEMEELTALEDIQLVDVRTPEEYNSGYIDGFKNINYLSDDFESDIEKLDKTKPVVVYCKSGKRSSNCAKELREKGFKKIYDLEGGISQWKHEGYKIKITP